MSEASFDFLCYLIKAKNSFRPETRADFDSPYAFFIIKKFIVKSLFLYYSKYISIKIGEVYLVRLYIDGRKMF